MKNKKGFTLVELLITIGLLALLGTTITISLNRTLKQQKDNNYDDFLKKVNSASNMYATNNKDILNSLYTNKGYVNIKMKDLIDEGLLNDNTINPQTNQKVDENELIKVLLDASGTIIIEYPIAAVEEDYLQTMDIIVEYNDNSITDYCYYKINEPSLGYITKEGNLVNNYLVKDNTIKCSSEKIDTSKLGTYELNYEYKLRSGSWKQKTRKVIVSDNIAPTCGRITGANTTWSKGAKTISVECQDNYKCNNSIVTKSFENTMKGYLTISDVSKNTNNCEVNVYSDSQAPTNVSITKNGLTLTGKGTDSLSGIKYFQFSTNSNLTNISTTGTSITPTTSEITKTYTVTSSETYYFYVQDQAGNITRSGSGFVDKTSPTMELTVANGTTPAASHIGVVEIADSEDGLKNTPIKIYYKWSTSNVTCSNIGSDYITITPTSGQKLVTGNITINNKTGNGKLYICNKDAAIEDLNGNIIAKNTIRSANMYLNNTTATTTTKKKVTINFDKNYFDNNLITGTYIRLNQNPKIYPTFVNAYENSGVEEEDDIAAINGKRYAINLGVAFNDSINKGGFYLDAGIYDGLKVGQTYTASFYIKNQETSEKTDTYEQVGFEKGGLQRLNVTNNWQKIVYSFTATNADNKFSLYKNKGNLSYYYIGVYLHSLELMQGTPSMYSTSSKEVGSKVTLPTEPTRDGFVFMGWFTDPVKGTEITANTNVPNNNATYYAHWENASLASSGSSSSGNTCNYTTSFWYNNKFEQAYCTGTVGVLNYSCNGHNTYKQVRNCMNATCNSEHIKGRSIPVWRIGSTYCP